jgi:hypothetical protein
MGSGGITLPVFNSALDRAERSAPRPGRLTPMERAGPRSVVDAVKKKSLACAWNRIAVVRPVARCYTD